MRTFIINAKRERESEREREYRKKKEQDNIYTTIIPSKVYWLAEMYTAFSIYIYFRFCSKSRLNRHNMSKWNDGSNCTYTEFIH